ncbi:MAG: ornithine cyclodeaminase [Cellvibrionaceae bacterium]|jgi:ornithine cyclodeaminase
MKLISLEEIKSVLPSIDLMAEIEAGFGAYSAGQSVVPPVGELIFDEPPGEVHIKYGYIKNDDYYVIKIASGFFENHKLGLPTSNGMMLLFSQKTGEPIAVLADEGYLTDIRTAVAGAIAAKYLAPKKVNKIGIVGTGVQARLQLSYLNGVVDCTDVLVAGRSAEKLAAYKADMEREGFSVETTTNPDDVAASCNFIVTTTPATEPLIRMAAMHALGAHITAMGSDTPHKQEVEGSILASADLIVADSISQCMVRGEIFKAIEKGQMNSEGLVELGQIILRHHPGRTDEDQLTIADLTGVAVQDIAITKAVYEALRS